MKCQESNPNKGWATRHGMSDGTVHERVDDAENRADAYVTDELNQAVQIQVYYEAHGGQGLSDIALTHFGHALHTVTDETSPEHAGFQPWYCLFCRSALEHQRREDRSATSNLDTDVHARALAHQAAKELWERYQEELQEERERQREKAEKEEKKRRKQTSQ